MPRCAERRMPRYAPVVAGAPREPFTSLASSVVPLVDTHGLVHPPPSSRLLPQTIARVLSICGVGRLGTASGNPLGADP
jgi:hypothetical protein